MLKGGVSFNTLQSKRFEIAVVEAERGSLIKFTDEQESEKARVDVERRGVIKLTVDHKF